MSRIEWTGPTWNIGKGCRKISPGCKNCYAEAFAERWRGVPGHTYEHGFDPRFVPSLINLPLSWRKPQTVFANSMSDLFLEDFTFEQIAAVYGAMLQTPQHTYQVLTKRADRMVEFYAWIAAPDRDHGPPPDVVATTCAANIGWDGDQLQRPWPPPNVHVGVSVETDKYAWRIADLVTVPAAVRFASLEPLLGDASAFLELLPALDWVIVGGESGPRCRDTQIAHIERVLLACMVARVPCFVKQLGRKAYELGPDLVPVRRLLKSPKGGEPSEWPPHLRVRQMPGHYDAFARAAQSIRDGA